MWHLVVRKTQKIRLHSKKKLVFGFPIGFPYLWFFILAPNLKFGRFFVEIYERFQTFRKIYPLFEKYRWNLWFRAKMKSSVFQNDFDFGAEFKIWPNFAENSENFRRKSKSRENWFLKSDSYKRYEPWCFYFHTYN